MSKKLNVGCGSDIKNDYINLDFIKQPGVDVVHDLNKLPWPFKDNTFDEVYCSHVLEHFDNLERIMLEIKRISKSGAIIDIRAPHFSCGVTYRDPTHKTFFSYFTFDYYTKKNVNYKKRDNLCFIQIMKRKLNFTRFALTPLNYLFNPIINLNPEIYERFFCWILPCSEVIFQLKNMK